jgi:hypothetical protein
MDSKLPELFKKTGEYEKFMELEELLRKWKEHISKDKVVWKEDEKEYSGDTYFAEDGFFPNYYNNKIKVLFIGREPRYIAGKNNIAVTYEKLENGNAGENVIRRILYIAHGIKNECKMDFQSIPYSGEIGKEYVEKNDFNFAFMEISKYSNENDDGRNADRDLMKSFFENSELEKYNFIQKELSILDPDVIITMNLWDEKLNIGKYLELSLGDAPVVDGADPLVCIRKIKINDKYIPLLDTYHFSAIKTDKSFYDPVKKIVSKIKVLTERINS